MDEVFMFNKSYQERLQEYNTVLGHAVLPVSQIKREWAFYLELAMEPKGWQAIWKIPRVVCEEFNIEFPEMVLVYVESVDFTELSATVEVIAVHNDILLPSKHNVALIQLWVTKEQMENFETNIEVTANALDMVHFFYVYLLMPWDYEDDDSVDWITSHLESRLHLFYDMKTCTIPRFANERLKCLLNKARRLQSLRDRADSESDDASGSSKVQELLEIQFQLLKIRTEVQLLENPLLRSLYLKRSHKLQSNADLSSSQNWLVFSEGKIDEYIQMLEIVRAMGIKKSVKPIATLPEALESANANDIILLDKCIHNIINTAGLPISATIKGLYSKNDTVLSNKKDGIMLECFGTVLLENLTINVNSAQCGIFIRNGKTTLRNCKVIGNNKASHHGIVVQPECHLHMIDSEICDFYAAVVANSRADITVQNCEITNSVIGLQIFDGCSVAIENSIFNICKQFGVYVETKSVLEPGIYHEGEFSILEIISDFTSKNISSKNIGKCEAIVLHSDHNLHIDDLFSPSELDKTLIREDSHEDMDANPSDKGNGEENGGSGIM